MAFQKGHPRYGGRRKKEFNQEAPPRKEAPPPVRPRISFDHVRDLLVQGLTAAGGAKYFEEQAKANPVAFLNLIAKTMPVMHVGDKDQPIVAISIEAHRAMAREAIRAAFAPLRTIDHETKDTANGHTDDGSA